MTRPTAKGMKKTMTLIEAVRFWNSFPVALWGTTESPWARLIFVDTKARPIKKRAKKGKA